MKDPNLARQRAHRSSVLRKHQRVDARILDVVRQTHVSVFNHAVVVITAVLVVAR